MNRNPYLGAAPAARITPGAKITGLPSRRLRRRKPKTGETTARLTEWHAMTPADRKNAWRDLVDWVAWLHDRYELSKAEQLPACWPQHPGLVEELQALKIWRDEIYTRDPDESAASSGQGAGQAARYWHAELRQVLTAAAQTYASGCRSGHRGAQPLSAGPANVLQSWRDADPLVGVDPALVVRTGDLDETAPEKTDAVIAGALMRGTAAPLARTVTDYVRYLESWWARGDGGWVKVVDADYARELDKAAQRLRDSDQDARRTRQLTDGL
ncbi:MAG: hypothetical protein ACRDXX_17385 [Stackebrandtia sp.]